MSLYLQPHTADSGPVLVCPGGRVELTAGDAMNFVHTLVEYLWSHRIEVVERKYLPEVEALLQEQGAIDRRRGPATRRLRLAERARIDEMRGTYLLSDGRRSADQE